jgi:hypothetical protein
MMVAEDLEAFVTAHQPHGPIEAGANDPDDWGYRAWAVCACGAIWQRWITDAEATADLIFSDMLAEPN